MSGRAWQVGGVALLGGVGYYMYQAGGDPKAAQKRAEGMSSYIRIRTDATKISNQARDTVPGTGKEAKKDAEVAGQDIKSQADKMARDAKANVDKADAKLGQYSSDAKKELDKQAKNAESTLNSAVDKFDKSATEGASKAKSGISSWFGGK